MFFFQTPLADMAVAHDDFAFLERLWQDWSPGWSWPPEEMAALKATFRQPGVLCGGARLLPPHAQSRCSSAPSWPRCRAARRWSPVTVPTLFFHGARDGCIGVELADGMEALFPPGWRRSIVPDAGHFVHQEQPDVVNAKLLEFLAPLR